MNAEAEIAITNSESNALRVAAYPGIAGWTEQFRDFLSSLAPFLTIDTSGSLAGASPSLEESWKGTFVCGLANLKEVTGLHRPIVVFIEENDELHHGFSTEQRLAACSNADLFVVTAPHLRPYIAGWAFQAGKVPDKRDFIIVYDAKHPAPVRVKILEALSDFRVPIVSKPFYGSVSGKPAFLRIASDTRLSLASNDHARQRTILPAENVAGIRLHFDPPTGNGAKLVLSLYAASGRERLLKRSEVDIVGGSASAELKFPTLGVPKGGTEVFLDLSYKGASGEPAHSQPLRLQAVQNPRYPLSAPVAVNRVEMGNGLALEFLPADSTVLYRIQVLIRRGMGMVRRGELRRVFRALWRRLPEVSSMLINRLKQRLKK